MKSRVSSSVVLVAATFSLAVASGTASAQQGGAPVLNAQPNQLNNTAAQNVTAPPAVDNLGMRPKTPGLAVLGLGQIGLGQLGLGQLSLPILNLAMFPDPRVMGSLSGGSQTGSQPGIVQDAFSVLQDAGSGSRILPASGIIAPPMGTVPGSVIPSSVFAPPTSDPATTKPKSDADKTILERIRDRNQPGGTPQTNNPKP